MPIIYNIDEFFNTIDGTPSHDSDGGGDYVDNTDDLRADKFNHRWNANNNMFEALQEYIQILEAGLIGSFALGWFYEPNRNLFGYGQPPFGYNGDGLSTWRFSIMGVAGTVLEMNPRNLLIPMCQFLDRIIPGSPEFAITSGNTNLFEIQKDWNTPATEDYLLSGKRWYRLGHDGGELTPAAVTISKTITSRAQFPFVEIDFYDHGNAPTGKTQVLRFESTEHNEYIELVIDPDQTNYRYNYALWDGAVLQTSLDVDTTVPRSVGSHSFLFTSIIDATYLILDLTMAQVAGETMEYLDVIRFTSNNDSGSADYFDISKCITSQGFEKIYSANTDEWIYIDLETNQIATTTNVGDARSKGIVLFHISIPSGATSFENEYITDYRNLSQFADGQNLTNIKRLIADTSIRSNGPIDANGNITSDNGNIEATNGNVSAPNGTVSGGNVSATNQVSGASASISGNITSTSGNIQATSGNVQAPNGSVSGNSVSATTSVSGNTVSATTQVSGATASITGNINSTSGNIQADNGNVSAPNGTVSGNVVSTPTGNITTGNITTGNVTNLQASYGTIAGDNIWVKDNPTETDIVNAITALGTGGGIIHLPASTITITTTINVSNDGIRFVGCGDKTIFTGSINRLFLVSGDYCSFEHIKFVSTSTTDFYPMLRLGCKYCKVLYCTFWGNGINGIGIEIQGGSNYTIESCVFDEGHWGVYWANLCTRVYVNHCTFLDQNDAGCYIGHSAISKIESCLFTHSGDYGQAAIYGRGPTASNYCEQLHIAHNNILINGTATNGVIVAINVLDPMGSYNMSNKGFNMANQTGNLTVTNYYGNNP